ncbi:MAG: hypothetical protein AOA66_0583 [Candidatus Bathyarchaeota archaeon BA2]|nr:MAG: hypothetical protein AOA66_0583 [Candidatus Bathyarchaeota archaeon BA2]
MKWLKEEDWEQWKNWIRELTKNKIFMDVFNDSEKLYDSSFINEVQKIINEVSKPKT